MNFKVRKFVPVLILLFLTMFSAAAFSANRLTNTVSRESVNGSTNGQHTGSMFVGDPVGGGGTPKDVNQTLDGTG